MCVCASCFHIFLTYSEVHQSSRLLTHQQTGIQKIRDNFNLFCVRLEKTRICLFNKRLTEDLSCLMGLKSKSSLPSTIRW